MGKLKNMLISQQEEEELMLEEQRQRREEAWEAERENKRLFIQDEARFDNDDETGFDFERDQGAKP